MELPSSVKELQRQLNEYVFSEDQTVSFVLRAHLMMEGMLDEMIAAYLPAGDKMLARARLSFSQKLELINSFDIVDAESYNAVKALNSLRNKLAHKAMEAVQEEEVLVLLHSFGPKIYEELLPEKENGVEHLLEYSLGVVLGLLSAELDNCLVNHSSRKSAGIKSCE